MPVPPAEHQRAVSSRGVPVAYLPSGPPGTVAWSYVLGRLLADAEHAPNIANGMRGQVVLRCTDSGKEHGRVSSWPQHDLSLAQEHLAAGPGPLDQAIAEELGQGHRFVWCSRSCLSSRSRCSRPSSRSSAVRTLSRPIPSRTIAKATVGWMPTMTVSAPRSRAAWARFRSVREPKE